MLGSTILDVAIGMCLIYLLFSLICSAVSELIEGYTHNRAADLERGIRELLCQDDSLGAVKAFYEHPLIYSLFAGKFTSAGNKAWWHRGGNLPSYIPSRNFALALLDLALPPTGDRVSGVGADVASLRIAISGSAILNEKTKRALLTLIDSANYDLAKARKNIEHWYDSTMDRVSGWYKRRTQVIIAVFALLAAATVNIDSIALVNGIAGDKSVRDSLVAASQEYARQTAADLAPAQHRLLTNVDRLEKMGLNIGWDSERSVPQSPLEWFLKVIGWILTACAATLGAPFWFDLLNKFIVVRSTVKPQEKSQEEHSKD